MNNIEDTNIDKVLYATLFYIVRNKKELLS